MAPFLFLACAVVAVDLRAQAPDATDRAFEVASVKPTLSAAQAAVRGEPRLFVGIRTFPGGRLTAGATLRALLARAYDIKDYQIDGGPDWMSKDYFAIDARAGGDATPDELNEMLRTLLAERFGLRAHIERRPGQVHSLVLARADGQLGPGLAPTSPECLAQIDERKRAAAESTSTPPASSPERLAAERALLPRARSGPREMTPLCGVTMGRSTASGAETLSVGGQSLATLVNQLESELGATVVDNTGLDGLFDYAVEFQTERITAGRGGLDPNSTDVLPLPLRFAIERQLGLKLESVDGEVPVLVVDAAERPLPD